MQQPVFVFSEEPFVSFVTEFFSAKPRVCYIPNCLFFLNFGSFVSTAKTSEDVRKIASWEELLALNLTSHVRELPVVHVRPFMLLGESYFPFEKTFLRQKHHDLADKFRVWHVMCSDNPISCRSRILEREWRFMCASITVFPGFFGVATSIA